MDILVSVITAQFQRLKVAELANSGHWIIPTTTFTITFQLIIAEIPRATH